MGELHQFGFLWRMVFFDVRPTAQSSILYIKFQVNRSLLNKSISFLPQGGARDNFFHKQIPKTKKS